MIMLFVLPDIQGWIDEYANWNTFFSLLIGVIGIILAIYFYKKQNKGTKLIEEADNSNQNEPYIGVTLKVSHTSRRMTGYGASCGEVIQAGHYKANYDVELELIVTIQNESPETIYELEVSFVPNSNLSKYKHTLIDQRENKLQPLEGNKHVDFILRMNSSYYDVYAYDVDRETQKINNVGKGISLLNGSVLNVKYRDAKHKAYTKTEVIA